MQKKILSEMLKPTVINTVTTNNHDKNKISGDLYNPIVTTGLEHNRPVKPETFQNRRINTNEQVLKILSKIKKLSLKCHVRGMDGPGSSLDLPLFQKILARKNTLLTKLPSTVTIASKLGITAHVEVAPDPNSIIYIAESYGLTKEKPLIVTKNEIKKLLDRNGKIKNKKLAQAYGPAFIFGYLFGLWGVKITLDEVHPMILAGGMESSNSFNVALISLAAALAGVSLSEGDIFNLAVKLENYEFWGDTGGQGHISALRGGASRITWLSGVRNKKEKFINEYSAFVSPLLSKESLIDIEDHALLIQAGVEYENGKKLDERTASLINTLWTDLLEHRDPIGFALHNEKLELAARYSRAISAGDYEEVVSTINRYTEIRDQLCFRWMKLAFAAKDGKKSPKYAKRFAKQITNKKNTDFDVVRKLIAQGHDLTKESLYSFGPLSKLMAAAKKEGIGIFPAGAGGPGAIAFAFSPKGTEHLKTFFASQDIGPMDIKAASAIVTGKDKRQITLKGYIPFEVGPEAPTFFIANKLVSTQDLTDKELTPYLNTAQGNYQSENGKFIPGNNN